MDLPVEQSQPMQTADTKLGTSQKYYRTLSPTFVYMTYRFISTDHNTSCCINIPIPMVVPSTSKQHKHEHITR